MSPAPLDEAQTLTEKASKEHQRVTWEALESNLQSLVNGLSQADHLFPVLYKLFADNLVRGRGLFCSAVIQAQTKYPSRTNLYASFVCAVNCYLPSIGVLLLSRLACQFDRYHSSGAKDACITTCTFIAHLLNQSVADEQVIVDVLLRLLKGHTDDDVEIAIGLMSHTRESICSTAFRACHDKLRASPEGLALENQKYIENALFQIRRNGWRGYEVPPFLNLVKAGRKITHKIRLLTLENIIDTRDYLDRFEYDDYFVKNEEKYTLLRAEVLNQKITFPSDADLAAESCANKGGWSILKDKEAAASFIFGHRVLLTIKSTADVKECCDRLLHLEYPLRSKGDGYTKRVIAMSIVKCCAENETYDNGYDDHYGWVAKNLVGHLSFFKQYFGAEFKYYYRFIQQHDSTQIRRLGQFFGHLFATRSIDISLPSIIQLEKIYNDFQTYCFIRAVFKKMANTEGVSRVEVRRLLLRANLPGLFTRSLKPLYKNQIQHVLDFFRLCGMNDLAEDLSEALRIALQKPPQPNPISQTHQHNDGQGLSQAQQKDSEGTEILHVCDDFKQLKVANDSQS
ncbi:armadillo-type protein [Xylariaceae sp. FL0255]|nr:armadillo-type protein [Xylariaceae sp. FL0255]